MLFSRAFLEMGGRDWAKKLVKGGCCRRRRDGPRANFVPKQEEMKCFRPLLELGEAWHREETFLQKEYRIGRGV